MFWLDNVIEKRKDTRYIIDMPVSNFTIVQHLEELRRRIIWSVFFLLIASVILYNFADKILVYLAKPVGRLVFIQPAEAFLAHLKISIFFGLIISLPVIVYHLLAFAFPGLKPNERKYIIIFLPFSALLFFAGAGFAYLIMIPFCIKFLLSYATNWLQPMISVGGYISFFCMVILIFGVVFELPIVILFLTRLGVIDSSFLRKNRKYAILVIFIVAAIFTPPDVFSQIIMAIPLLALYEISIFVSYIGRRK